MGTYQIANCPITGLPAIPFGDPGADLYEYYVTYNNKRYVFRMNWDLFHDEEFWKSQREKIKTLLYNGIWFDGGLRHESIRKFLDENPIERTPYQKIETLLEYLNSLTSYEGESTEFPVELLNGELWRRFYFTNGNEAEFYVRSLQDQGLIKLVDTKDGIHQFSITLDGLAYLVKISESKNSRFCFVAMSFADEMEEVYIKAIFPAIKESGFEPIRIKDENLPSDVTINDAILAAIKRSKFTISEFTGNRNGVYFEAGYALGLGQNVIYTCRKDEFDSIHFDTNHYQYIVWETLDQLKQDLINKIEVTIKA